MIPDRVMLARRMAEMAHAGQVRKHTGEPYANHCHRVADTVRTVGCSVNAICAAYMHDTIEDTDLNDDEIEKALGWMVRDMVLELTTLPRLGENRARRKERERLRLATAEPEVQTIKLADILDNVDDIVQYEPDFAPTFLKEKWALYWALDRGDPGLRARVKQLLDKHTNGEKQEHAGDARLRDVSR